MSFTYNPKKKKKDFEKAFKNGKFFKENFLILKTTENNIKEDRFGFIVSQKVSKKAGQGPESIDSPQPSPCNVGFPSSAVFRSIPEFLGAEASLRPEASPVFGVRSRWPSQRN